MTVAYRGPKWLESTVQCLGLSWFDRAVELRLHGANFDDQFVKKLRFLDRLESVTLINTSVTRDAVRDLRNHLPDCKFEIPGLDPQSLLSAKI